MSKWRKTTARIPLFYRLVSLYAVAFTVVLLIVQIPALEKKSFTTTNTPINSATKIDYGTIVQKQIIDGVPQQFAVPRFGINLPVRYGDYNNTTGEWTLSNEAIYYVRSTALPNNQSGNTFLYGHNRDQVIARLSGLVSGDIATVTTTNSHIFTYVYTHYESVSPDDISVLFDAPNTPRLTVMTCGGIWSQSRKLMYFDFVEVK